MVYVTMTDKFMSDWGMAEGKTNKLVFECEDMQEAEIVADNARARSEMKRVSISQKMPRYSNNTLVSFKTKEDAGNWFVKGYFSK